ncbi:MAG: GNAT family N-acetyltransferase [Flavobacterium psychrophilum]
MAKSVEIRLATATDFSAIESIARQTWPLAYGTLLSKEQLNYMLDLFYSKSALKADVLIKKHYYYLAFSQGEAVGFAGIEHQYLPNTTKLHKLYVLPHFQRQNLGIQLLDFVSEIALEAGCSVLTLNVNRYNSAKKFYKKNGFTVVKSEDIELEHGYLMEDYVLVKSLV